MAALHCCETSQAISHGDWAESGCAQAHRNPLSIVHIKARWGAHPCAEWVRWSQMWRIPMTVISCSEDPKTAHFLTDFMSKMCCKDTFWRNLLASFTRSLGIWRLISKQNKLTKCHVFLFTLLIHHPGLSFHNYLWFVWRKSDRVRYVFM